MIKKILPIGIAVALVAVIAFSALSGEAHPVGAIPDNTVQEPITAGDIIISPGEHFYNTDIAVELDTTISAEEKPEIYYTTDGSEPTKESRTYKDAINVKAGTRMKATALKVKVFYGNGQSTDTYTHTYFVGTEVNERFDTLVFSLTTDEYNIYDHEYGVFIEGKLREEYLATRPSKQIEPPDPANFNIRGKESERPMYTEVFEADGTRVIAQLTGMRVHGGWSRASVQKSMKLIARRLYTPDEGKLEYDFFPSDTAVYPFAVPITDYDRILLRNNANDMNWAFMRDELTGTLARKWGFPDVQDYRPAAVYLNGDYFGFYWVKTVVGTNYLEDKYGGEKDDYAIIDVFSNENDGESFAPAEDEIHTGEDYAYVTSFADKDFTDSAVYEEFKTLVDVENWAQYLAIQTYIDNRDWPRGNSKAWRYYGEDDGSKFHDGKWRYFLFDAEFAWGLYNSPATNRTLERLVGAIRGEGSQNMLMTAAMENEEFRELFINMICELGFVAMSSEKVSEAVDMLYAMQKNELEYSFTQYMPDYWCDLNHVRQQRQQLKDFGRQRFDAVKRGIKSLYGLTEMYEVEVTGASLANVKLGSLSVGDETVHCSYYVGNSVNVIAQPAKDSEVTAWIVNGNEVLGEMLTLSNEDVVDGKITVSVKVKRSENVYPLNISEISSKGGDWIEIHNTSDVAVSTKGLYLTDDPERPMKWSFPEMKIQPNEYLQLMCDNATDVSALLKVEVNFNIKTGETIMLTGENGIVHSVLTAPDMTKDQSYALDYVTGEYRVTNTKTPGMSNAFN